MSNKDEIVFAQGLNVGDRVRKKNGRTFANGEEVVTIKRFEYSQLSDVGIIAWFTESDTNLGVEEIELAHEPQKNQKGLIQETIESLESELSKTHKKVNKLSVAIKKLKELNDIE